MEKKKEYQKPEIKAVKLIPEEAVLSACKSTGGTNRSTGKCETDSKCVNKIIGS